MINYLEDGVKKAIEKAINTAEKYANEAISRAKEVVIENVKRESSKEILFYITITMAFIFIVCCFIFLFYYLFKFKKLFSSNHGLKRTVTGLISGLISKSSNKPQPDQVPCSSIPKSNSCQSHLKIEKHP